jgi:hypothetical protein
VVVEAYFWYPDMVSVASLVSVTMLVSAALPSDDIAFELVGLVDLERSGVALQESHTHNYSGKNCGIRPQAINGVRMIRRHLISHLESGLSR